MARVFLGMDRPTREEMQKLIDKAAGSYALCCLDQPHSTTTVEGAWDCWRKGHYDRPVYKEVEESEAKQVGGCY